MDKFVKPPASAVTADYAVQPLENLEGSYELEEYDLRRWTVAALARRGFCTIEDATYLLTADGIKPHSRPFFSSVRQSARSWWWELRPLIPMSSC